MNIGIPRETFPGERRVALVPEVLPSLIDKGIEIRVEAGAGEAAGFADRDYEARGAHIVAARAEVFAADTVLQVRTLGANPAAGHADLELLHADQVLIGFAEPLTALEQMRELAACGVSLLAMELLPRITRAQSMDVLSSMATIAGYKAVLLAAERLPRMFPLLMTAAGTLTPSRVLVVGAGVAGLQAIATARRLGAVVEAYDLRPAVREQVESLGARFVELDLDAAEAEAEDAGGYARDQDDDFYRRQQEAMGQVVAAFDVVITTAAVPGKKAPVLISREMVTGMDAGAIIIDLAAERGGNCELTRPGETVVEGGVQIVGPLNLPATVPHHASQMYAHNISSFLKHLAPEDALELNPEDEITSATLVLRQGQVVHPQVLENNVSAAASAE